MNSDLARREPQSGAVATAAPPSEAAKTLAMILEAARDPSIDAAKTEQMVNLALKLQDREMEATFNRSKNAAIQEMPVITKDGRIVINDKQGNFVRQQGTFAKWENLDRVVRPILAKYDLALFFEVDERESGGVLVRPILSHANGFTERGGAMPVPADLSGSKNAAQAIGSAVSYGKRYSACAMLNIVTEGIDDDGNMGAGRTVNVSLPYEREAVVLKDAKAAHEAGSYQDWYDRQPPKDRAWLVQTGNHAEFGGKALPKPTPPEAIAVDTAESKARSPESTLAPPPAQDNGGGQPKPKPRQTPREWADAVMAEVDKITDGDRLDEYEDGKRDLMARLRGSDPQLWQEVHDHIVSHRERINEGRLV